MKLALAVVLLSLLSLPLLAVEAPDAVRHNGCYFYTMHGLPCLPPAGLGVNSSGTVVAHVPAVTPPNWGTSVVSIHANFDAVQLYNLEVNPGVDTMLTNMSNALLAEWSQQLELRDSNGYFTYWVLAYAVSKGASAANIHRLESAFGPTAIAAAMHWATAPVWAAYNATPLLPVLSHSAYWVAQGNVIPASTTDDHLLDLLLDEVTLQANETSKASADKAVMYAQIRLGDKGLVEVGIVVGIVAGVVGTADIIWNIYTQFDPNAVNEIKAGLNWYGQAIAQGANGPMPYGPIILTIPDLTEPPYFGSPPDPDLPDFPPIDIPTDDYDIYVCTEATPC